MSHAALDESDQTTCSHDEETEKVNQLDHDNEVLAADDNEPIARRLRNREYKNYSSTIRVAEPLKGQSRARKKACKDSKSSEPKVKSLKGKTKTQKETCKSALNNKTKATYSKKKPEASKNKEEVHVETETAPFEVKKSFFYHQDLTPLFGNTAWIEILQEIYGVWIDQESDCELNISGPESSVASVISTIEELTVKYNDSNDTMHTVDKNEMQKLVSALKPCLNKEIALDALDGIPDKAVTSLLSSLAVTYKENFSANGDSPSLDDSVLILNITEDRDDSVVILDSDVNDSSFQQSISPYESKVNIKNEKEDVSGTRSNKNIDISLKTFHGIPNNIISMISSLLEKSRQENKENSLMCGSSSSLEDSVVIIDTPQKKTKTAISAFVLPDSEKNQVKTELESEKGTYIIVVLQGDGNLQKDFSQQSVQQEVSEPESSTMKKLAAGGPNSVSTENADSVTNGSAEKIDQCAAELQVLPPTAPIQAAALPPQPLAQAAALPPQPLAQAAALPPQPLAQAAALPPQPLAQAAALPPQPLVQAAALPPQPLAQAAALPPQPLAQAAALPPQSLAQAAALPPQPHVKTATLPPQPSVLRIVVSHSKHAGQAHLRPVVIDGSNVALYAVEDKETEFSWKRIVISAQYFINRGHDVKIFMPQHRRALCYKIAGKDEIDTLECRHKIMIFTPSRKINGKIISCYDDRFIVDYAHRCGGVILSNDNYRDLMNERQDWGNTIKKRLLMYVFVGDEFMIPSDPLGRWGPNLDKFLRFPNLCDFHGRR